MFAVRRLRIKAINKTVSDVIAQMLTNRRAACAVAWMELQDIERREHSASRTVRDEARDSEFRKTSVDCTQNKIAFASTDS